MEGMRRRTDSNEESMPDTGRRGGGDCLCLTRPLRGSGNFDVVERQLKGTFKCEGFGVGA